MTITGTFLFPFTNREGHTDSVYVTVASNEDCIDNALSAMCGYNGTRQTRCAQNGNCDGKSISREAIIAIVIFIIIDIFIMCLAIHYIIKCSETRGWGTGMIVLLILLMFVPGIGPIVTLGILLYALFDGCDQKQMSFKFY